MVQRFIRAVVVALACTQAAWAAPVVTLTAPANNASYASPANIMLSADASDAGGSIAKVEFYVASALIGAATQTPYTVNWTSVASGSYSITAKATNSAGESAVSAAVTVNVTGGAAGTATGGGQGAQVYYVQPDHLNTPRMITDSSNNVVWRWDNAEPFGNNVANENPAGLGAFTYNLRFPGQYFDRETNLHYNGMRDYDPQTGRYIESDPIGLDGGSLSTYVYVNNQPTRYVDPDGLQLVLPMPPVPAPGTSSPGFTPSPNQPFWPEWVRNIIASVTPSAGDSANGGTGAMNACPPKPGNEDPCKGIREQLREHERKYQEYISNPSAADNKGILAAAYASGDMNRYTNIINGRIRELDKQIQNFRRQLEECERRYGKK